MSARILTGDALEQLRTLADASVQCVVTSPPYYGLRDYGASGQLGLEPTPAEYIAKLVDVFREVRRVLRKDGVAWVNMGDSYAAVNRGENARPRVETLSGIQVANPHSDIPTRREVIVGQKTAGIKPKDLMGMPWRLAFALQADGWWLRQDIIWAKPNPMPESVTDRCTKAHEYVFLLSKSERYFYDAAAISEASAEESGWAKQRANGVNTWSYNDTPERIAATGQQVVGSTFGTIGTRNKRSVWTLTTEPFSSAAYGDSGRTRSPDCPVHGDSENLVSTVGYGEQPAASRSVRSRSSDAHPDQLQIGVLAPTATHRAADCALDSSDSPARSCADAATPRSSGIHKTDRADSTLPRVIRAAGLAGGIADSEPSTVQGASADHSHENNTAEDCAADDSHLSRAERTSLSNAGTCRCRIIDHFAVFPTELPRICILAGSRVGDTILDPFNGSGTTGQVALELARQYIGVELNPEYVALTNKRLNRTTLGLPLERAA